MARLRPEDCAIDRATDRHGFHEVAGQLLAGGVSLAMRTCLFHDNYLRHALTDERSFRAHLEFRERLCQIVFPEIFSATRSPVDLFRLVGMDQYSLIAGLANQIVRHHTRHDGTSSLLQQRQAAIDDKDDGNHGIGDDDGPMGEIGPDKMLIISRYLPQHKTQNVDDIQNDQKALYLQLCDTQRYFAYRRLLMKLDFIQPDNDLEDVLEKLKYSARWPEPDDHYEHRRCLENHLSCLKKYGKSKIDTVSSISEYEQEINSALSSRLQTHLGCYDGQYYDRMKFSRLARECATQAQSIGVILVGEALPVNAEVRRVHLLKRIQGKFRSPAAGDRPRQLLPFCALATVAAAGGFVVKAKIGMDSRRSHG